MVEGRWWRRRRRWQWQWQPGTCSRSRGTFSPLRYDVIASRRERSALALAFIRVSDVVTDPMITAFAEMPTIATKSEQTV